MNKLPDLIEELRMLLGRNVTSAGFIRDRAIAELTRLRQIEADAKAAGQITRDGKSAGIGAKVWHPKHGIICGFVEVDGDSNTVAAFRRGFWDGFGERPEGWNDYPVSDCYSTPEAAEAAREEKA